MAMNSQYGVSTWLWTSPFTTDSIENLFKKVADLGFTAIEIAVEDPAIIDNAAVKKGLDTMAGVIDSPYRGEVKVLLVNHDEDYQVYSPGDKIAQIIIQQAPDFTPVAVDNLNETSRGENGFGSSGS